MGGIKCLIVVRFVVVNIKKNMKIDTFIDKDITRRLMVADDEENGKRVPSGKLTASTLGNPLQWQILKSLGVPKAPVDGYTLRKFARGRHVEEWLLGNVSGVTGTQVPVDYRGVVGFADATVDTAEWDYKLGIIPVEVKSVSNAKFKRLKQRGETDRNHRLQGGLYATALGAVHFAVIYVASDDYQIRVHIHETDDSLGEINAIISEYDAQKESGLVPPFTPIEKWQADAKYNPYPEWASLTAEEIKNKLKEYGL